MDYASISPSGTVLAATGLGLFSGALGQTWLLLVVGLMLVGAVLIVKTRFRRGKTPTDV